MRPALFNRVLAQVKGQDYEPLVNEVVLRSQAQAEYSAENYGHFGLNLRRYAHFTSPIRRYADLIVHRALIRALGLGEGALPETETLETLSEVAAQISVTERRAMKAERETADRLIAHFLADRIGATFQGRISGVTRAGLFVKLIDTGADGLIPIRTLGTEYFNYDETRHALVGSRSGAMHRLGDVVDVRLVEAAPVAGALRFELLSEGQVIPRGRKRDGRDGSKAPAKPSKAHPGRSPRKKDRKPGKAKARQIEERQVMETVSTATTVWTRDTVTGREARPLDRDEARLSLPLPALRRRQAVSRLPEDRQQLLGLRARFHAAPRRRSAGLSRDRHRRPHRGTGWRCGSKPIIRRPVWLQLSIYLPFTFDRVAAAAAAGQGRRGRLPMGAAHARL